MPEEHETYSIRQGYAAQMNYSDDGWIVTKKHEDGTEDDVAFVQTETMAELLINALKSPATRGPTVRKRRPSILTMPIAEFGFSVRSNDRLTTLGIRTIGELVKYTAEDLTADKRFGGVALLEIRRKLELFGLCLKDD